MSDKKFQELQEKRSTIEVDLKNLERQIYDLETRYLEETATSGNVFKGWEGYLQIKNPKQGQLQQRKAKINQNDRLFSLSSITSPANQMIGDEMQEKPSNGAHIVPAFRPKRTKKKKNYSNVVEIKKQQEQQNKRNNQTSYGNDLASSSSSDDYQGEPKKKGKISKKY